MNTNHSRPASDDSAVEPQTKRPRYECPVRCHVQPVELAEIMVEVQVQRTHEAPFWFSFPLAQLLKDPVGRTQKAELTDYTWDRFRSHLRGQANDRIFYATEIDKYSRPANFVLIKDAGDWRFILLGWSCSGIPSEKSPESSRLCVVFFEIRCQPVSEPAICARVDSDEPVEVDPPVAVPSVPHESAVALGSYVTPKPTVASNPNTVIELSNSDTDTDKEGTESEEQNTGMIEGEDDDDDQEEDDDDPETEDVVPQVPDEEDVNVDIEELDALKKQWEQNIQSVLTCEHLGLWAQGCQFFLHDPKDTARPQGKQLPWTTDALYPYQQHAVFMMIVRCLPEHPSGGILGDEMGLGKTRIALAVALVHYILNRMDLEVKAARARMGKGQAKEEPATHLPLHGQAEGAVCPSGNQYGIQCCCVEGSLSAQLAASVPSGPTVIFTLAKVKEVWAKEYDKYFTSDCPLRLAKSPESVQQVHNQVVAKITMYSEKKKKKTTKDDAPMEIDWKMVSQKDYSISTLQSRNIFLFSNVATKQFKFTGYIKVQQNKEYQAQIPNRTWPEGKNGKYKPGYRQIDHTCIPGLVFMDEFHEYKGENRTTKPIEYLQRVARHTSERDLIWAVTGTPFPGTPHAVISLIELLIKPSLSETASSLGDSYITEFNTLCKNATRYFNQAMINGTTQVPDELVEKMRQFFKPLMIRRTKRSTFFGDPVSDLKDPVREIIYCNLDAKYLPPTEELWHQCVSIVAQKHKEALEKWRNEGKTGPKPQRANILQSDKFPESGYYHKLRTSACWPAIIKHAATGEPLKYTGTDLKYIKEPRAKQLESCQYMQSFDEIVKDSPKLPPLMEIIKKFLADKSAHPTTNHRIPKYMCIATQSPVSAYLIQEHLHRALETELNRGGLEIDHIYAQMKNSKREYIVSLYSQNPIKATAEGPYRILATTANLIGTGLNLIRANYMVLFEKEYILDREKQTADRIHRDGQKLDCYIFEILNKDNPVERAILKRQEVRQRITSAALVGQTTEKPHSR